ncbi:MAG TPA: DUF433 domain-containing protein [Gemmataceae bacterium]|nr:DUF433 domain-containing protein [Gemmataceae bacterium]
MITEITIVDRGRGPQLSTCRITVLDLVPYFQKGSSHEEIRRWIPTLSPEEIAVVERYYLDHKEEFDDTERARERRAEQVRQQRLKFPELNGTREEHRARLHNLLEKRRQEPAAQARVVDDR